MENKGATPDVKDEIQMECHKILNVLKHWKHDENGNLSKSKPIEIKKFSSRRNKCYEISLL